MFPTVRGERAVGRGTAGGAAIARTGKTFSTVTRLVYVALTVAWLADWCLAMVR